MPSLRASSQSTSKQIRPCKRLMDPHHSGIIPYWGLMLFFWIQQTSPQKNQQFWHDIWTTLLVEVWLYCSMFYLFMSFNGLLLQTDRSCRQGTPGLMLPSNVYMKIFDELRNGALGESLGRIRGIFGKNHQKRTKNSKTCRRIKREHHEIDHSIDKFQCLGCPICLDRNPPQDIEIQPDTPR
jgi:hypothetical protein